MIYTTDLDRTVIYSNRVISEYPSKIKPRLMEVVDGLEISYTSTAFFNWLKEHDKDNDGITLVANTARSKEEYNRLKLAKYFDYNILANGGVIRRGDKRIDDWDAYREKLIDVKLLEEIVWDINRCDGVMVEKTKIVDNTYVYTKVRDKQKFILGNSWIKDKYKSLIDIKIQGIKVYVLLKVMNKGVAIKWLSEYIGEDIWLASGDSETDIEMLSSAKVSMVPRHGVLVRDMMYKPDIIISNGIRASIDILDYIKKKRG